MIEELASSCTFLFLDIASGPAHAPATAPIGRPLTSACTPKPNLVAGAEANMAAHGTGAQVAKATLAARARASGPRLDSGPLPAYTNPSRPESSLVYESHCSCAGIRILPESSLYESHCRCAGSLRTRYPVSSNIPALKN